MLFEWSGHPFWEITGTGLTIYVGTCKDCLSDQNISPEKSEALDSQTMLEHAKIVWVIMTSLLRNQRHWAHILCWNMQRLFEWSRHFSWEITGTRLTFYVGICKGYLSDQNIPPKKSQALDSQSMLEHAKVVWVIRTSLLRNHRHQTHSLYKDCLSDQDFPSEKSEVMDLPSILKHAKIVWVIRTSLLRNQRHWTHNLCWNMQRLFEWLGHPFWEIRGGWTHSLCWNMQKLFEWSEHLFWEIRGTGLTSYIGSCKGLGDQDIQVSLEKLETLDSQPVLKHSFQWNWSEIQFIFT